MKESLDLKYKTLSENKKELEENLKKLQDAKARLESENIKIKESNKQRENLFNEEEKTILEKISREAEQVVDDIFNFSREKLFEINKIILKYSIVVLKSKVLKEKEKIVENLEFFRDYIFAGKKEQYSKIISNLEDFYKYLSLVFPVVISTLHSSPKLFSG
ncbi:MAG: hypothetical protein ACP5K4_11215, partial [Caldisericum sp.]